MAIRIDPALNVMPKRLQDELTREMASSRSGPIAAAVLPLNRTLLDRQARIDTLTWQVKQADERGDEAMRRALAAEAMLERLQTRWRRLGALVEFGMWGVLIKHDPNEAWADDGAALTALLDSPAVATEADQCERALRPNVQVSGDQRL